LIDASLVLVIDRRRWNLPQSVSACWYWWQCALYRV